MVVFCASPWIPVEWIAAHGHEPRGPWFERAHIDPVLAEGVCAFAQATTALTKCHPEAAFVLTTACDQMRRAADGITGEAVDRSFLFNLPATWESSAVRKLYRAELDRLGRFLERIGGQAPSDDALRDIIHAHDKERTSLLSLPTTAPGREVSAEIADYWSGKWTSGRSTEPTTASGRLESEATRIPLALVGGPLTSGQWSLFDHIESSGGRVVINATEPGERTLLPPIGSALDHEDPRSTLANHYFDHIVDVFQRPNTRLYTWLGERLEARNVRGILLWAHVGCDLWRAELETLREAFGLPVLLLESHEIRTIASREIHRLEAFIESLG